MRLLFLWLFGLGAVSGKSFLEWLIEKDEASRTVVASGDSIVLHVDVSALEAKVRAAPQERN